MYNAETLGKVYQMTRDIDLAPSIDHDRIVCIATEKMRYAEATRDGIDTEPQWRPAPKPRKKSRNSAAA